MDDVHTRQQLLAEGMTAREISRAVRDGRLLRVRPGRYASPTMDAAAVRAVRIGGRLTCCSELRRRGVWVLDEVADAIHVQLEPNASRLRLDRDEAVVLHWRAAAPGASASRVGIVDALLSASRCLERRAFIASVDSALRLGQLRRRDLLELRRMLPRCHRPMLDQVDRAAQSGLESIVRVLVRDLGLRVRSQVPHRGVGHPDLLVEEAVVIETDGDKWHDEKVTTRDRRRDAGLVRRGRSVLHFRCAQVVYELPQVASTIIAAVASHRGVRDSGKKCAPARSRARLLDLS